MNMQEMIARINFLAAKNVPKGLRKANFLNRKNFMKHILAISARR